MLTVAVDEESEVEEKDLVGIEEVCNEEATPIGINEALLLLKRLEGVTSNNKDLKDSFYKLKSEILKSFRRK